MRLAVLVVLLGLAVASPARGQVINGETPYDASMLTSSSETDARRHAAAEAEARAAADREASRNLENMLETSGSRPAALR